MIGAGPLKVTGCTRYVGSVSVVRVDNIDPDNEVFFLMLISKGFNSTKIDSEGSIKCRTQDLGIAAILHEAVSQSW